MGRSAASSSRSLPTAGRPVREVSHGRGAHAVGRRGRYGRISRSAESIECGSRDTPHCLAGRMASVLNPMNDPQGSGWAGASPARPRTGSTGTGGTGARPIVSQTVPVRHRVPTARDAREPDLCASRPFCTACTAFIAWHGCCFVMLVTAAGFVRQYIAPREVRMCSSGVICRRRFEGMLPACIDRLRGAGSSEGT